MGISRDMSSFQVTHFSVESGGDDGSSAVVKPFCIVSAEDQERTFFRDAKAAANIMTSTSTNGGKHNPKLRNFCGKCHKLSSVVTTLVCGGGNGCIECQAGAAYCYFCSEQAVSGNIFLN